jgi:hypothetical protein
MHKDDEGPGAEVCLLTNFTISSFHIDPKALIAGMCDSVRLPIYDDAMVPLFHCIGKPIHLVAGMRHLEPLVLSPLLIEE